VDWLLRRFAEPVHADTVDHPVEGHHTVFTGAHYLGSLFNDYEYRHELYRAGRQHPPVGYV
jgi:hypothetical protein